MNLFDMHHEVLLYFDDEEDGPAVASTETDAPTDDWNWWSGPCISLAFSYSIVISLKNIDYRFQIVLNY